ncbi:MAG TPA: carboxypeptidase regulatory-like domain-containing protein, partial [Kofleriaceae bacterium]|nr:carboxypeptidase regulatory-like domain-containing protein [Kofleriaceae bacterium]
VDWFVGKGAPGPIIRGGVHAGYHLTRVWSVLAFVELAKVPGVDAADAAVDTLPLIPYEPMITGGVGLQARFGGRRTRTPTQITTTQEPQDDVEVIEYAEVGGTVTDDAGTPVAGAKVTVRLQRATGTATTDAKGAFVVTGLPIGKTARGVTELDDTNAEVTIVVGGKKPFQQTLTLGKGPTPRRTIALESLLPPGQLRAVLRAAGSGKPIPGGTVTISPGDVTATSAADGTLSIDLSPGNYKATASAPGFKQQTLHVVVDPNGVALKNFELRK